MSRTIGQLLLLLSSDFDGEVLAAVRALRRALKAEGKSLHDLAKLVDHGPQDRVVYRDRVDYQPRLAPDLEKLRFLRNNAELLSAWEQEFSSSLLKQRRFTERQREVLNRIYDKLIGAA